MNLKEQLSIGFIAGLIAGIVMDTIDHLFYTVFKGSMLQSIDWVAIGVYGHRPTNFLELVLSQIMHLIFTAFLGMIFIYFTSNTTSKNNLLNGWIWGILVWFISNALVIILRVPGLTAIKTSIIAFHFLLASIYGLVLAAAVRLLKNLRW